MGKVTVANETYIKENANRLSVAELHLNTGLSMKTIAKLLANNTAEVVEQTPEVAPSSQHDTSVVPAKRHKSEALKRMTPTKGVTVMTEEMSSKGEKPVRKSVTESFAKSIHRMYNE